MRYWFGRHCLAEVNVTKLKHERGNRFRHLHEGQEARDADCGVRVFTIGPRTGDQSEAEFLVLSSCDGKEGGDRKIAVRGLVRLSCDGQFGVLWQGNCVEKNFPMFLLKVQASGRGCRSKERGVPHDIVRVACYHYECGVYMKERRV